MELLVFLFLEIQLFGLLLFITHLLSCLTVGIVFRFWKYKAEAKSYNSKIRENSKKAPPKFSDLGGILQNSIMSSIKTVVMIGGFVVLFSVIISILNNTGIIKFLSFLITPILSVLNIPSNFASGILGRNCGAY